MQLYHNGEDDNSAENHLLQTHLNAWTSRPCKSSTSPVVFSIGSILVGVHLMMNGLRAASVEVAIFGFGMKTPVEHLHFLHFIPIPKTHQPLRCLDLGRNYTLEDIPLFKADSGRVSCNSNLSHWIDKKLLINCIE